MNALDVYLHDDRAGVLERLEGSRLRFTYAPEWLAGTTIPLSLSLPARDEPYADPECRPFFAGLLPEGEFLRSIARTFHISADNPFTVLQEIGGECAGAVSLVAHDDPPPFADTPEPIWLSEGGLAELLLELPRHPLLAGREDGRPSRHHARASAEYAHPQGPAAGYRRACGQRVVLHGACARGGALGRGGYSREGEPRGGPARRAL